MLIGHKSDEIEKRKVTEQEAEGIAKNLGVKLQETSCRASETILAAYEHLIKLVMDRRERAQEAASGVADNQGGPIGEQRAESFRREGM